jgi:hypothetical protein
MKYKPFLLLAALLLLLETSGDAAVLEWLLGPRTKRMCGGPDAETTPSAPAPKTEKIVWHDDYAKAYDRAKATKKMLLINFVPEKGSRAQQELESALADRPDWQSKLQRLVLCRVPADAEIVVGGERVQLLAHGAFGEMHGRPGLAIVDLAHEGQPYYGHVVSAFPFMSSKYYQWRTSHFATLLDLPPGTITQRSMIWAVRTHPEKPASTSGVHDATLSGAASSHSRHQASIGVQGHHNWEGRFQRLRRLLGGGLPVEVVAESWPGQTMIDSCVDCVDSWRQSSGHWSAVRSPQSRFGYDIRRGRNGIWYGTGIFLR